MLEREGTELPPALQEEVQQLRRDADELSQLLGELLDLARLEAQRRELPLEPIPLGDVIEEVVAQLRPLAEARSVRLTGTTSTPIWVRANLARTRQVLRAHADNALKHTPSGGSVELEVSRDGDYARVRVMDSGDGIPSEHLPRVFDRFYRVDPARSRSAGGAGLGLAIVAQLVSLMHGRVRLDSEPGQGTTATLHLPLARAPS